MKFMKCLGKFLKILKINFKNLIYYNVRSDTGNELVSSQLQNIFTT